MKGTPHYRFLVSFLTRAILILTVTATVSSLIFINRKVIQQAQLVETQLTALSGDIQTLNTDYQELSYESHLASLNTYSIEQSKQKIEQEYQKIKSEASSEKLQEIEGVFTAYKKALDKIERNTNQGLATTEIQNQIPSWGEKFLNQKFDELLNTINSSSSTLDQEYQTLLAEQAAAERAQQQPTPTTAPALSTQLTKGYAQISVSTERGIFIVNLIKHPLNEIRVLTLTANNENCANNCPTKSLAQYVSENSGFAGIHGSYFCPPDYATCTNKTNSYDFAVYNSALGKWLNENSLGWTNMGLLTFAETQASLQNFYVYEPEYTTPSVTAAIQNYPSLVYNNQIVAGNFNLTSYQETKGYRGAIGFNNTTLFLAITSNTSVSDLAYVMKALGASYSLNLDGGGSSAMYYQGSYRVGPGRSLPNAIVLQNR